MFDDTDGNAQAPDATAGRPSLRAMLARPLGGALLFGITPPRQSSPVERVRDIATVTMTRLAPLDLDGLVLYDIDDESDRNSQERPFPYLPTMDPAVYRSDYLGRWDRPIVIYRSVGKYAEPELRSWLRAVDSDTVLSVFVGASSSQKAVRIGLPEAQRIRRKVRPDLLLGGVTITERHSHGRDEHQRLLRKQRQGCTFFISQVVYDVDATKSLISDYHYACREQGLPTRPLIFTLSVCGSLKTLEFLKWLGVEIPGWLENTLQHTCDPLAESYEYCVMAAGELSAFCRRLGVPFGFNVESVSIRRAEIDASIELARQVRALLDTPIAD